ncbi:MAG: orotate phosphoribosyltransferase [Promethearchaeota archaeon]
MNWKDEKERFGKEIMELLYEKRMIKTWYRDEPRGWTLISGIWSPFYIQLRPLCSFPDLLKKVGSALGKMIQNEIPETNRVVGVAMAGIPIATAIALVEGIPATFTRKLEGVRTLNDLQVVIKKYGEHALLEGELEDGDSLVIVDDLVTKFDSKLIAIEQVKFEVERRGLKDVNVDAVVVLLDREQGASKIAKDNGIKLHPLIPFTSKGIKWLANKMPSIELAVIKDYLENPKKYQNVEIQKDLQKKAAH